MMTMSLQEKIENAHGAETEQGWGYMDVALLGSTEEKTAMLRDTGNPIPLKVLRHLTLDPSNTVALTAFQRIRAGEFPHSGEN